MFRKTILGFAAAAAVTAIALGGTATTASAGKYFKGHHYHYGFYKPHYCKRIFVGYRKVWTYYGWKLKPWYKKVCY